METGPLTIFFIIHNPKIGAKGKQNIVLFSHEIEPNELFNSLRHDCRRRQPKIPLKSTDSDKISNDLNSYLLNLTDFRTASAGQTDSFGQGQFFSGHFAASLRNSFPSRRIGQNVILKQCQGFGAP